MKLFEEIFIFQLITADDRLLEMNTKKLWLQSPRLKVLSKNIFDVRSLLYN